MAQRLAWGLWFPLAAHRRAAHPLVQIVREDPPPEEVTALSALLARELAPPYLAAMPRRHGRVHAARPRPQPTPEHVTLAWLRARGAHDATPLLTAHPTSLTAEVHFRRTDAYWLVLCHRAGCLLRAVETPFRIEGVVLLRRMRLGGPWQAERALVAVPSEFLADGACLYAAQSGPLNWDRLTVSPHPERFEPFIAPCTFRPGGEHRGRSG